MIVAHSVMLAKAGVHGFFCCDKGTAWISAFAGMTQGPA
jgi:hypothetical protein